MSGKLPVPIRLYHLLMEKLSHPVKVVGIVLFGLLFSLFWFSGVLFPDATGPFGNPLQVTGAFLLLSMMPPYLLMCCLVNLRANDGTHEQLAPMLGSDDSIPQRFANARFWPLAALLGVIYAQLTGVWGTAVLTPGEPGFLISVMLIGGQTLLWIVVGVVLFFSMIEGWVFNRIGKSVTIDLFRLDQLNGFGRAALNSFLMVVGAMAITVVQSIDQEFRFDNYSYALIVAVPAAIVLVILPTWAVHKRIKLMKRKRIAAIDEAINTASRELNQEDVERLNALVEQRDYVHGLRNWPMDLSIFARFLLYVFIPPLAWIGAALMEILIDASISS